MQFVFDHLTAIVVAAVLLLSLAGVTLSSQENAIDAVRTDARFSSASQLVEFLEQDLPNVGAGVPATSTRIHERDGDSLTVAFEFSGAVAPTAMAPVDRVRYELHPTGTAEVGAGGESETVTTYEVRRLVHDGTSFQPSGRSRATLTEFSVALLDASGAPISGPLDNARVADVRLAFATPLGGTRSLTVSRWQRRIPLSNLTNG